MKVEIVCNPCFFASDFPDRLEVGDEEVCVQSASDPDVQRPGEGEDAMLVCPPLAQANFLIAGLSVETCDRCGRTVAVSPSSKWLLDARDEV